MNEELEQCLAEWLENPYWREYYETAPSDECKEFIALEFMFNDTEDDEIAEMMDEAESKLKVEDLKHLAKYEGNTPRLEELKQRIAKMEA